MKNKIIIIILAVLSVLFLGSGIYGLIFHPKEEQKKPEKKEIINNELVYKYFLDDLEETKIPTSTEENKIIFSKYECTNNITGTFNTNKWQFETTNNQKGECKLYFVNSKYEVTLTAVNGLVDENNPKYIERDKDGEFIIIPNDGYEFKEAKCSNSKTGTWDSSTNIFKINAINSNITCQIDFVKMNLKIDILVENGKGAISDKVEFGESKTFIIEPSDGYGNPNIQCTNEQEAKFDNNSLSFNKVLSDTKCIVSFTKNEIKSYSFEIKNPTENDKIVIEQGSEKIVNVGKGTELTIKLRSIDETLIPTLNCKNDSGNTIIPTTQENEEKSSIRTFKFLEINNNISCTIGTANK